VLDRRPAGKSAQAADPHGVAAEEIASTEHPATKGPTARDGDGSLEHLVSLLGCSHYVPMVVETLGDAFAAGWRITARCAWGKREGMKTRRECHYTRELDLETLVWTRGPNFPLSSLEAT
jgi:hypothetical protein